MSDDSSCCIQAPETTCILEFWKLFLLDLVGCAPTVISHTGLVLDWLQAGLSMTFTVVFALIAQYTIFKHKYPGHKNAEEYSGAALVVSLTPRLQDPQGPWLPASSSHSQASGLLIQAPPKPQGLQPPGLPATRHETQTLLPVLCPKPSVLRPKLQACDLTTAHHARGITLQGPLVPGFMSQAFGNKPKG